jgi:hypothetical protein
MALSAFEELCIEELRRQYGAIERLNTTLPRVLAKTTEFELRTVLEAWPNMGQHRLAEVFERLDCPLQPRSTRPVEAMFRELEWSLSGSHDPELFDAIALHSVATVLAHAATSFTVVAHWLHGLGHRNTSEILMETARRYHDYVEELVAVAPELPIGFIAPGPFLQPRP